MVVEVVICWARYVQMNGMSKKRMYELDAGTITMTTIGQKDRIWCTEGCK